MLKFLEEPNGNIIGFFITNHLDNVMLTIQSRCQHLSLEFDNNENEKFNLTEGKYKEYLDKIKGYLNDIENSSGNLILNNKIYLDGYEKEDIKLIFQIILDIYKNALENNYNGNQKETMECLKKYSANKLKRKIDLIINILGEINYNVNLDLLLDKFVIEMDGINYETI